jgi:UDP-2,4-diacetamido-2,4,6-trideoxy-beta-L-altropyranose hydrolase
LCEAVTLKLRRATDADRRLLWEWANDRAVRAGAFHQQAIEWADHVRWFAARVASPNCAIYVVTDEHDVPVAQVRFDVDDTGVASVDISVTAERRGTGIGSRALQSAVRAFREHSRARIQALIRPENQVSLRAFAAAGFVSHGVTEVAGIKAVRMELPPNDRTPHE